MPASDGTGSTNLFAGVYGNGVYLSTNSGTSWNGVNSGLTDNSVNVLDVFPSGTGSNFLYAGTSNRGVYLSTNNGTSWNKTDSVSAPPPYIYTLALSGNNLFAGSDGYGIFLSTNNGTTWTADTAGLTNKNVWSITVYNNNLYAATWGGGVFLSTNNGTTWTADTAGLTNLNLHALTVCPNRTGGTNLFAMTYGSGVFQLNASGTKWTAVDSGLTNKSSFSATICGTNIFVGTISGVYLSTNSGTSWTGVSAGLPNFSINTLSVSGTNLFAGTYGGGIWERPLNQMLPAIAVSQSNLGFGIVPISFSKIDTLQITNTSTAAPLVIDSVYTKTKWYAVTSLLDTLGISKTLNLTIIFTPDSSKSYIDTLYIVSNAFNPLIKVPLSGNVKITGVSQNNSNLPTSYGISQNYPNPFNPTTVINYQLPASSFVTLKVYDILGREVATLVNGRQNAGYYNATFNAVQLSSGIYFYRLQAGSFTETKKLVLLK